MLPLGLHSGISDADYFAIDLPSSSTTKTLIDGSNAHLGYLRDHPEQDDDTDALTVGAFVHSTLLQPPEVVDASFLIVPEINRRTNQGKADYERLSAQAAEGRRRLITGEQVERGLAIVDGVLANTPARNLLSTATHREIVAIGEIAGRPCKAKLDALIVSEGGPTCVIDIKTAATVSPGGFARAAATYHYYHQAAFYTSIMSSIGHTVEDVVLIAAEKTPPFTCCAYRIPETAILTAQRRLPDLVSRWIAVQGGNRDGFSGSIATLTPPRWWTTSNEEYQP